VAKKSGSKLEGMVRRIATERYPASVVWWLGELPRPIWAPWNAREFERLSERWREVARRSAAKSGDAKVYGDHSRRAVVSILHHQSWKLAHVPLMHLRTTLQTLWIFQRMTGVHVAWEEWLTSANGWLDQLLGQSLSAGDPWIQAEVLSEQERIRRVLNLIAGVDPGPELKAAIIQVKRSVARIRDQFQRGWRESMEPPGWTAPANLDSEEWKRRRQSVSTPVDISSAASGKGFGLGDVFIATHPSEVVHVDELSACTWVLPTEASVKVAVGSRGELTQLVTDVRIWWWQQAKQTSSLAWALADPLYIEAVLIATWAQLADNHAESLDDDRRRVLARLVQNSEVMASADAWLWLEEGDLNQVFDWLCPFFGASASRRLISRMQVYPGYWMERERLRTLVQSAMTEEGGDLRNWSGWQRGPEIDRR